MLCARENRLEPVRRWSLSLMVGVAAALATPGVAAAATLYVAPAGSGASCTQAAPCSGFNSAYQAAALGDVVQVAAGSYPRQTLMPNGFAVGTNSLTPDGNEVTFRPALGASVTVAGIYLSQNQGAKVRHVAFEGMRISAYSQWWQAQDAHMTGMTVRGTFHVDCVQYFSLRNSDFGGHNGADGIDIYPYACAASDEPASATLEGNTIHDIDAGAVGDHPDAVAVDDVHGSLTVRNNRFYRNTCINWRGGDMGANGTTILVEGNFFGNTVPSLISGVNCGMSVQMMGDNAQVRYNTIEGTVQQAGAGEGDNQRWSSNIVTGSVGSGQCPSGVGTIAQYNVWSTNNPQACGGAANTRVASPSAMFESWSPSGPTGSNLHLVSTAVAINKGDAGAYPVTDIDGEARSAGGAPDAGADEYNSTLPPPPPPGDTEAPSAPAGPAASGALGEARLSWSASTDNVGVVRYNVHRSMSAGFTPSATNRIAQPTSTSYTDGGLAAGDYYYRVVAEDAAGNLSAPSDAVKATASEPPPPPPPPPPGDTEAPSVSLTAPANGASVSGTLNVAASASDNLGVAGLQFRLDGSDLGSEDTSAPYSRSWDTTSATNGQHTLTVVARDAVGNRATSATVTVSVNNVVGSALVAAYGFEEPTGGLATDSSGVGNTGTLSGATRSSDGRFGRALSFDGVNDWVTVADSSSLDLVTNVTLEAWVKPTALSSWRTVLVKEQPGDLVYGLYADSDTGGPAVAVRTDAFHAARGTQLAPNGWRHLAATYDGAMLRLYVDGTQVGTSATTGAMPVAEGPLHIGGNSVWGEWFSGTIDELRVYHRVLSQTEIQNDMTSPVVRGTLPPPPPDTQAPTVAMNAPLAGTVSGAAGLAATASDDRGVSGVEFKLDGMALGAEDSAAPYQLSWDTTRVANGQHALTATARDAAGNRTTSAPVTVTVQNQATQPSTGKRPRKPKPGAVTSRLVTAVRAHSRRVCGHPRRHCRHIELRVRFRLAQRAPVKVLWSRLGSHVDRARRANARRMRARRGWNAASFRGRSLRRGRYLVAIAPLRFDIGLGAQRRLQVR